MLNRIPSVWNWCKIALQKARLTKSSQNCNNTYVGRSALFDCIKKRLHSQKKVTIFYLTYLEIVRYLFYFLLGYILAL